MDRKVGYCFDSMTNNRSYLSCTVPYLLSSDYRTLPGGHVMQKSGREDVPVELIRHCLLPHVAQTRENGRPALRHELPQKLD